MSSPHPLVNDKLVEVLELLVQEPQLPALDRWFSRLARQRGLDAALQRHLWNGLRLALTRGYQMLAAGSVPGDTQWQGFCIALKGQTTEWAKLALRSSSTQWSETMAGIPSWLSHAFTDRVQRSGWSQSHVQTFLSRQEHPLPVHVRFRWGDQGSRCLEDFLARGIVERSDVDGIYQLCVGAGLEASQEFKNGLIEIQDVSSQLSIGPLKIRPGMAVWDVCSGRGGKTLLAAHELRGKGLLYATDISQVKLDGLKERVRRSGWQNIRIQHWDGLRAPDFGAEVVKKGGFDRVIVDAPCTASGTWRRDPEARYRITPESIQECVGHQSRLLRLGWSQLKKGGLMAYITCSWLPSEDEEVVEGFAQQMPCRLLHKEILGCPRFEGNTLFVAYLEKL